MRYSNRGLLPHVLPSFNSPDHHHHRGSNLKERLLSPFRLFEYGDYATADSSADKEYDSSAVGLRGLGRSTRFGYASRSYFRLFRLIACFTIGCLCAIVLYQFIWSGRACGRQEPFDEVFPLGIPGLRDSEHDREAFDQRFESFMHNVLPIQCHSHNDYWRRTPLYAAIGSGCISVEADVWSFDDNLYVGHRSWALSKEATLSSMYLGPIERMLRTANQRSAIGDVETNGHRGVFSASPEQTLVLLIDFKANATETYDKVYADLETLRQAGWLTFWNGTDRVERALTIVASGNVPYDRITANETYRDIFCDAPLDQLNDEADDALYPDENSSNDILRYKYNPSNSYYASTDLKNVVGQLGQWSIKPAHIEAMKQQIHDARIRGLLPRYWGVPRWPTYTRDYTWEILSKINIGILNVDDLRAARKGEWGHRYLVPRVH